MGQQILYHLRLGVKALCGLGAVSLICVADCHVSPVDPSPEFCDSEGWACHPRST
jgi:hypothetical protein